MAHPLGLTSADIFDEYIPVVWRVLRALGVAPSDLDDACQEVFVTVHRCLPAFDGSLPVRTWVYGICARTASEYRRRAPTCSEVEGEPGPASALYRILDRLDDDRRAVFVLREIEDLAMTDVVDILACSPRAARSRLLSARRQVEEAVARGAARELQVATDLQAASVRGPQS